MNWNVVRIDTTEGASDLISSILMDAGATGVELIGGSVPTVKNDEYLKPLDQCGCFAVQAYYGEENFNQVLGYIKGRIESVKYTSGFNLGSLILSVNEIGDTDWNANFKKHFTTFRAAGNIVIKPTWEEYQAKADDIVVEMDPGMAFGSGVHETTKMCIELVQKHMKQSVSVLDIGCGSGILGIACAKMGVRNVLALDYDSVSVAVTRENAKHNGVENLEARQSDLLQNADKKKYDIVLANIIADIVIRLNGDIMTYLKEDSVYIVSGIIEERLNDVKASLNENDLQVIETLAMADWCALAIRRSDA